MRKAIVNSQEITSLKDLFKRIEIQTEVIIFLSIVENINWNGKRGITLETWNQKICETFRI